MRSLKALLFAVGMSVLCSCGANTNMSPAQRPPASATSLVQHASVGKTRSRNAIADSGLTDLGLTDPNQTINMEFFVNYQPGLDDFIHQVSDPASTTYGQFLTPSQFDSRFGALPATKSAITAFLSNSGLSVSQSTVDASVLEASGPVSAVNALFLTTLHDVKQADGTSAYMWDVEPTEPTIIAENITAILGLDSLEANTQLAVTSVSTAAPYNPDQTCPLGASAASTDSTCCAIKCGPLVPPISRPTIPPVGYGDCNGAAPLAPPPGYTSDLTYGMYGYATYTYATDYNMPVQHGCSGSPKFAVAIVSPGSVSPSDLENYWQMMAIPRTGAFFIKQQGTDNEVEATLDVETVSGLAPGADVYLYSIPKNANGTQVANEILSVDKDNVVSVASMSIGACENTGSLFSPTSPYGYAVAEDSAISKGTAEGISFIASSGDSGGPYYLSGCKSVMAPASVSYALSLGGTEPYENSNGFPYEAYRNNDAGSGFNSAFGESSHYSGDAPPCSTADDYCCGTGGGASTHFKTTDQFLNCQVYKCVPDLALSADINYRGFLYYQGAPGATAAGTSFAAPMFAAIQAEIDQRQNQRKGDIVGRVWTAWKTYGYSSTPQGSAAFYDVVTGNSGYQAVTGYDAASGIGTVDGWSLSAIE